MRNRQYDKTLDQLAEVAIEIGRLRKAKYTYANYEDLKAAQQLQRDLTRKIQMIEDCEHPNREDGQCPDCGQDWS